MTLIYKGIIFEGNFTTKLITPEKIPLLYSKLYSGIEFAGYLDESNKLLNFGRGRFLGTGFFSNKFIEVGNEDNWSYVTGYSGSIYGIKNDGTLWVSGSNNQGQLGTGNNVHVVEWTKINNDTNWSKVVCGNNFAIALKTDGTIWGTGRNNFGQLGLGYTSTYVTSFTQISSFNDIVDIAAGDSFFIALRSNGTIWGTGVNSSYQLANNLTNNFYTSLFQLSNDTDWFKFDCGLAHTLLIKTNGTLWAKGSGFFGDLGLGAQTQAINFTQVGTANNWSKVACSFSGSSYAIRTDGTLWASGRNDSGQLGLGNNTNVNVFTQVNSDTDWVDVNIGTFCAIALKSNGTVYTTGSNSSGQLGQNNTSNYNVFTLVNDLNNVVSVFKSENINTTIKRSDNKIWFSGTNGSTNTNLSTTGDFVYRRRKTPINNTTINSNWTMIDSLKYSSIGIRNGNVYTWGENNSGQLGFGNTTFIFNPTLVPTFNGNAIYVSSGWETLAVITDDGKLYMCGLNNYGQLGLGNTNNYNVFTQVPGSNWRMVSCGWYHSMAIKNDGTLWASGANYVGQLGIGNFTNQNSFVQVGTANDWVWVSCGQDFTIAKKKDGTLWGAGNNSFGQLGLGAISTFSTFTKINNDTNWNRFSCGGAFSVALKTNGTLWSTGSNNFGQLGLGDNTNRNTFTQITLPFNSGWIDIDCSDTMFIAKRSDNTIYTVGNGVHFRLGNMSTNNINVLTQIS